MSGARHWEQDKEATVYIGNLDERVSDALVWELMLQAGRIVSRDYTISCNILILCLGECSFTERSSNADTPGIRIR